LPSARSLAVGFAMASLVLASYAAAKWTPLFALQSIEVVGADRATALRVRAALSELEGESLVGLRADDVRRRVAALPGVVTATHDRAFPHTLVVFVQPERPVAVLRRGDESWLMSARGRAIARLRVGARPALPRIWVKQNVTAALGALVSDSDTLRAIQTLAIPGVLALPAIRTARVEGNDVTLVLRSGLELRLGGIEDAPLKLAIAARVIRRLTADGDAATLYLDVSVPERPVTGTRVNL
jgi:cell division protein FtsQ